MRPTLAPFLQAFQPRIEADCAAGGRELALLPEQMEARAEELRRGEGLLLADEQPPEAVTAKAAFAASVRTFLLQQARPKATTACFISFNMMHHVQQMIRDAATAA